MASIILFLLFHLISSGQIIDSSFNLGTGFADGTGTLSFTVFSNKTLYANKLYLFVFCETGGSAGTLTSGVTWTNIVSVGNNTRRIQIWRYMGATTVTNISLSMGNFGGPIGHCEGVFALSGAATGSNGANAIVQAPTHIDTTSADPFVTMSAISSNRNMVIASFLKSATGGSPETGWTQTYTGTFVGGYIMTKLRTDDNTPTMTQTSTSWIASALEIQAAPYRRVEIN